MSAMTEQRKIDEAYGELRSNMHLAVYAFERGANLMIWLLQENRWKLCGAGFKQVDAFVESLRMEDFRLVTEARKKIAMLIKAAQPKVSNRAIGRALGVSGKTIDRQVATNVAVKGKKASENKDGTATNVALSGREAAKVVERAERIKDRQNEIESRIAKVAFDAAKLGKFSVILADPPWDDEFGASNRSIENHYPTMHIDDILALPIEQIAHEQAMLFLWATPSMLELALRVMKAWQFDHRTNMIWVKPSIGLGKYVRQKHEILLIGRRGDHPAPAPENLSPSVIEAPRGEHSAKPEIFHEIIERMYPNATKIELFRRGESRRGWSAWGAEAKLQEAAE